MRAVPVFFPPIPYQNWKRSQLDLRVVMSRIGTIAGTLQVSVGGVWCCCLVDVLKFVDAELSQQQARPSGTEVGDAEDLGFLDETYGLTATQSKSMVPADIIYIIFSENSKWMNVSGTEAVAFDWNIAITAGIVVKKLILSLNCVIRLGKLEIWHFLA